MGCDRKTWPQSTSILKNEKQKMIGTSSTCSIASFKRKEYKILNFLIFPHFCLCVIFTFAIHIITIEGSERLQTSHHGRETALPSKKCDILVGVQVRAVEEEEERVRRGNVGERYLFLSFEVKQMDGDKLDIAIYC